jgi:hypothetical protein
VDGIATVGLCTPIDAEGDLFQMDQVRRDVMRPRAREAGCDVIGAPRAVQSLNTCHAPSASCRGPLGSHMALDPMGWCIWHYADPRPCSGGIEVIPTALTTRNANNSTLTAAGDVRSPAFLTIHTIHYRLDRDQRINEAVARVAFQHACKGSVPPHRHCGWSNEFLLRRNC